MITDCEIGCCGQKSGQRISQYNEGITSARLGKGWAAAPSPDTPGRLALEA